MKMLFVLLAANFSGSELPVERCQLEGTWRSDRQLTLAFIEEHARLEDRTTKFLAQLFGRLEVTFEDGNYTEIMPAFRLESKGEWSEIERTEEKSSYKLLYCTSQIAVVQSVEMATGNPLVLTYNFSDPGVMWVYLGNIDTAFPDLHIREYYRKVDRESAPHEDTSNYMFKPTPELTLRLHLPYGRRGLTWR
jgi:hypothetical protein